MPTLKEVNRHMCLHLPCGGLLQQPGRGWERGAGGRNQEWGSGWARGGEAQCQVARSRLPDPGCR
jgi:hypothetical protein